MERIETDWMSSKTMELPLNLDTADASYLTRVEVYQDSSCLIDEEFRKKSISIGRSTDSDIVLPDKRISRHHFNLYIDSYQVFIFVLPDKQPLSINGQPVKAALLGTDDTIELGPYILRIRVRFDDHPSPFQDDLRYQVVFEGKIQKGFTRKQVAKSLKNWLKINGHQTAFLFSGNPVVVRPDLNLQEAIQFKNEFEKSGAVGQVQAIIISAETESMPFNDMPDVHLPGRIDDQPNLEDISAEKSGSKASKPKPVDHSEMKSESLASAPQPTSQIETKPENQASASLPVDRTAERVHSKASTPLQDGRTEEQLKSVEAAAQISNWVQEEPESAESEAHLSGQAAEMPKNGKSASHLDIHGLPLPNAAWPPQHSDVEDEDDEDEDDFEASFSLKEKLSTIGAYDLRPSVQASQAAKSIGVFKFRDDSVIDVRYLSSKESYYINANTGRFRLAQKNGSEKGYLYLTESFTGTVRSKESGAVSISDYFTRDHMVQKRKRIYRLPIPDSGDVMVNDGCFDYLIRPVFPSRSPAVSETRHSKELTWKHGAYSVLAHLIFLAVIAFMPASALQNAPEPETRFVKVDPQILEQLQPKPKPVVQPPPTKPKAVEPAAKPVQKKEPVKKKPKVKKKAVAKNKPVKPAKKALKTASRKTSSKSGKKVRKASVSRDPKAGGGHGKGNTANRNIKQVGVLGMLGDSTSSQIQPAIAEVTNLDAVRSNNSGQAKFKVGGIKGKLGTSEISVSGGDVVATKGNSQVLRSYGAGGSGRVAALQKGSVGQKQVKGMVQASLSKSVRIRGGMSREDVKRVIQQHLDEITYCYETALISNPSIKGKITMEWKILMSGAVGEVRIKTSTVKSPEIYSCIKSAIKTWRFPKPVGNEVVVSYPFIFDVVGF